MEAAALIGDIVGSRGHRDRHALHDRLREILGRVNQLLRPSQLLDVTVGDEFQGCFGTVAEATHASALIRLMLLTDEEGADSRYGIGWGVVTVYDATRSPISQDGPGWWSARAAIEKASALAKSPRSSFVRTCFMASDVPPGSHGCDGAVDAFLLCRDAAVGQMTDRQRRLLLGVLLGDSQGVLAEREGITQSAVSQTLARSGGTAIHLAHRRLSQSLA